MSEQETTMPVANGHTWPCTRFYNTAGDYYPCTCPPQAITAPDATSADDVDSALANLRAFALMPNATGRDNIDQWVATIQSALNPPAPTVTAAQVEAIVARVAAQRFTDDDGRDVGTMRPIEARVGVLHTLAALRIEVAPDSEQQAPRTTDCAHCGGHGEAPDPDPHDERFYPCQQCGGDGEVTPAKLFETTEAYLADVQARAAAATDGPWRADDEHGLMPGATPAWTVSRTDPAGTFLGDVAYTPQGGPAEREDAVFIAHARTDVPRLAAVITAVLNLADQWEREDQFDYLRRIDRGYAAAVVRGVVRRGMADVVEVDRSTTEPRPEVTR